MKESAKDLLSLWQEYPLLSIPNEEETLPDCLLPPWLASGREMLASLRRASEVPIRPNRKAIPSIRRMRPAVPMILEAERISKLKAAQ